MIFKIEALLLKFSRSYSKTGTNSLYLRRKILNVKSRLKISKNRWIRLAVLVGITSVAVLFDHYFEKHPEALKELHTESEKNANTQEGIYLFSQTLPSNVKSSVQKSPSRKLSAESHGKLLQKWHQLRIHQFLRTEPNIIRQPFFLSHNHLIFRRYFFDIPDEVPLLS